MSSVAGVLCNALLSSLAGHALKLYLTRSFLAFIAEAFIAEAFWLFVLFEIKGRLANVLHGT